MDTSFISVKRLAEKYPDFSEASIRYYLFNREQNGLSMHVRNLGRKILISEVGFLQWIDNNGSNVK